MRVCILSTVHAAFDTRVFHREAKSLVGAGFDVGLIIQHDPPQSVVDGVRITGLPTPKRRWGRIQNGWRAFRRTMLTFSRSPNCCLIYCKDEQQHWRPTLRLRRLLSKMITRSTLTLALAKATATLRSVASSPSTFASTASLAT